MMSGVPLETCWAFKKRWNNKFYNKVASCWLFLLICSVIYLACNAHASYYIVICDLSPSYFYTLSQKDTIFEKKVLNIKCVFWLSLQLLSEIFRILRRTERDMIINIYLSLSKVTLVLSDFNLTWIFSKEFRNILKCRILWKSVE